ncbi:MAG: 50S ribosomal protein L25/general stress protein Ctc [Betaproteobacteria bacterium TMED100]|nr:MAG: 50S ribosomal protein L25/general stress protein Ctc [Betaproteobacteria bacterium TMED100]|tara:strand:+ start:1127 stop:1786 length:660 start_codon:yes stop_codon:yes gene_type:complete
MPNVVTDVHAQVRNLPGSSNSRKLRRSGKVPGVVYGAGKEVLNIELEHNSIMLALDVESFHSSILSLEIKGKKERVLLRDFQVHPYKQKITHIDFQRVDEKKKLHTKVPLHYIGEEDSPAVKLNGGLMSHVMTEVELTCLPKDLPGFIEVDLSSLDIGNSIHVREIKLPEGVDLVLHGQDDPVIATAVKPKVVDIVEEEVSAETTEETPADDTEKAEEK